MSMCVKLNSLFDREMKIFLVTEVLKQGIKLKTMCPNYKLELRNMNSHRKSCLLNHWPSAILVNIVLCKLVVSFVASFEIGKFYLKIRITTFKFPFCNNLHPWELVVCLKYCTL